MDEETGLMDRLSEQVRRPDAFRFLEGAAHALRHRLAGTDSRSTHVPVPLEIYGGGLPAGIRSSWVFVLRPGQLHPAERHPNSIQRMFALGGDGAMEVWEDGAWSHCPLSPAAGSAGLSIPALRWHRPALLDRIWEVVSFHSVEAEALIEELGDPERDSVLTARTYLS